MWTCGGGSDNGVCGEQYVRNIDLLSLTSAC